MRKMNLNDKLTTTEFTRLAYLDGRDTEYSANFLRPAGAIESFSGCVHDAPENKTRVTVKKVEGGKWQVIDITPLAV